MKLFENKSDPAPGQPKRHWPMTSNPNSMTMAPPVCANRLCQFPRWWFRRHHRAMAETARPNAVLGNIDAAPIFFRKEMSNNQTSRTTMLTAKTNVLATATTREDQDCVDKKSLSSARIDDEALFFICSSLVSIFMLFRI